MAAKVAEADAHVHSLAMSVAVSQQSLSSRRIYYSIFILQPVTSWKLYGKLSRIIIWYTLLIIIRHHIHREIHGVTSEQSRRICKCLDF